MMLRRLCFLWLCFIGICCNAQEDGWKKYENFMYSIEIPSDWEDFFYQGDNPYYPLFQDRGNFRACYMTWVNVLIRNVEDIPKIPHSITVYIVTRDYKEDKTDLRQEVKDYMNGFTIVGFPKKIYSSVDEEHYVFTFRDKATDGTIENLVRYLICKEDGKMRHRLTLTIAKRKLKKEPELQKTIDRILNSFILRKHTDKQAE